MVQQDEVSNSAHSNLNVSQAFHQAPFHSERILNVRLPLQFMSLSQFLAHSRSSRLQVLQSSRPGPYRRGISARTIQAAVRGVLTRRLALPSLVRVSLRVHRRHPRVYEGRALRIVLRLCSVFIQRCFRGWLVRRVTRMLLGTALLPYMHDPLVYDSY